MAITTNTANMAVQIRIPVPVVGVHLNKTNARMPQAHSTTPRRTFRVFSFIATK
jgi:hypothetical protein